VHSAFGDVLSANERFAATYQKPRSEGHAARRLAVVTCMDSRLHPPAILGLDPGDAILLRNAGARVTDDVLRTLVLATSLLKVARVIVLAHTDCRMTKATDDQLHSTIRRAADLDTRSLDFGAIADQHTVLARDVQRIRSSPFLPANLDVIGCVYDIDTGHIAVLTP
jgi:carbonic anhydrase